MSNESRTTTDSTTFQSPVIAEFMAPSTLIAAPHQTVASEHDDALHVRTVFAVEPAREHEVHERIDGALAAAPAWRLERGGPSALRAGEAALGARMAGG